MEHTDFYSQLEQIKAQEVKELKLAIKAHGGQYEWHENRGPWVVTNSDEGALDVQLTKIRECNGTLLINGLCDGDTFMEVFLGDIMPGQIDWVLDCMPPTEKIEDVTATSSFKWTENALTNLQYITLYYSQHYNNNWLRNLEMLRQWAIEFTEQEPDCWEESETDYESAVADFIQNKLKL